MSISIIIPSYNGIELIKKNIPQVFEILKNQKINKKELIVVDDKSTDASFEYLEKFKKENDNSDVKIIVYQNKKNLGFSSNVNKGVEMASGEIVMLLNSDVVPSPNFIEPLLARFTDDDVFAVGCMDESIEGDSVVLRGRGIGGWKRGFMVHSAGKLDKDNTLWVSGGSGAFRRSIWNKLGGLEELYNPFYWEDIDLSYRALKSGYKIFFENKSIVRHEHEKGAIKNQFTSAKVKKISYRNQISFVWLNITDVKYLILHFLWLPYHIFNTLVKGDYLFIWALMLAIIRIPKIISKRNMRKIYSKLSDAHVLLPFSAEIGK